MSERHWKLTVLIVAELGNISFGRKICVRETKMFLTSGKKKCCFRAAKFVLATYVSRAAKLGNSCFLNNVSATIFPSLARPLDSGIIYAASKVVYYHKVRKQRTHSLSEKARAINRIKA